MPDRVVAHHHTPFGQFPYQGAKRYVRRLGQPSQQPVPFSGQRISALPPIGLAAAVPVDLNSWFHFTTLETLTSNRLATTRQV
jgi:hypothetical protein